MVNNDESKIEGKRVEASMKNVVSPYALSAKDDPENVITRVVFTGRNYDEWVRKIRTGLRAKKKLGFVDGTVKAPPTGSEDEEDCLTANAMVTSWIFNTIEPKLRTSITHREIAKELWDSIKTRFSTKNGVLVQQLKEELMNCKQRGLSLEDYYGKLQIIWEDLANYETKLVCNCGGCTCGGCTCELVCETEKARENEKLHQFCLGLDVSIYGNVRSAIVNMDPLPSVDHAYSMVSREEQMNNSDRSKEIRGDAMAFAVKTLTNPSENRFDKRNLVCSHCSKNGHDISTCYQINGYPDWWVEKFKGGRGAGGRGVGGPVNYGRGRGSYGRGNSAQAHVVLHNVSAADAEVHADAHADAHVVTGLTQEQWEKLVRLLGKNSGAASSTTRLTGKSNTCDWIVDSGASHHMTGTLENLCDMQRVTPCLVGLPNGNLVLADQVGSVILTETLILKRVLYVTRFRIF